MVRPELVYFAAMFLVALPVAWFAKSRIAALVFAVWAIGQTLWLIGMPEPETQCAIYVLACASIILARSTTGTFAAVLFIPLALASLSESRGWMSPYQAWWTIYWIALTQAASLPFNPDLYSAVKRWRSRNKEGGGMEMLRTIYE